MGLSEQKNLVGQTFSKLLVVERAPSIARGETKMVSAWLCRCDCGNEKIIQGCNLRNGTTKSCGCIRDDLRKDWATGPGGLSDTRRLPPGEAAFNSLYSGYRASARERNLVFELSKEEFRELTSSNCFYCDVEPSALRYNSKNKTPTPYTYNGVDRKNNSIGYITSNVVSCCKMCNFVKGARDDDVFIAHIKKIYEHLNL